jgi:hypothetical protein
MIFSLKKSSAGPRTLGASEQNFFEILLSRRGQLS